VTSITWSLVACGAVLRCAVSRPFTQAPGPGADADSMNQAGTKTACFQQVRMGAVMAALRHAGKVTARAIRAVLAPSGSACARRSGVS
jgi:hypothetical protein